MSNRWAVLALIMAAQTMANVGPLGLPSAGIVADRVGSKRTLLSALSLQALLIFPYLFAASTGALHAVSLAFGVAYGGAMPLCPDQASLRAAECPFAVDTPAVLC